MSVKRPCPTARPRQSRRRTGLSASIALTLALGYLIVLGGTYLKGDFLTDPQGQPIANDFVNVVAAGRLVLAGNRGRRLRLAGAQSRRSPRDRPRLPRLFRLALSADISVRRSGDRDSALSRRRHRLARRDFRRLCGGVGRHSRPAEWLFLALGFPAALWNITAGQNGFLTAALIGGTLGLLERRPALAGICLGLLTYKPQFGLLFPLVLIADRRWLHNPVAAAVAAALTTRPGSLSAAQAGKPLCIGCRSPAALC